MEPTLTTGNLILAKKIRSYINNDVVLARVHGREVIKRLQIGSNIYNLIGDNKNHDHNELNVDKDAIFAKVLWPRV